MTERAVRLPAWVAEVDLRGERPGLRILGAAEDCEIHRAGHRGVEDAALFEGYLYRPEALARRLEIEPGTGGAELVATAYRLWGEELVERLDGSFVAAVWDGGERRLVVGHDAFGHHPLFYHWSPRKGRLHFSSNVLALAHCGRLPVAPDRLNMALNLRLARPTPGGTYFEGIRRLPPGHRLELAAGGPPRPVRHWSPVPEPGEEDLDAAVVLTELEGRLIDSLERRMVLAPDGVMLSGGLDSVVVAALASEYTEAHGLPPLVAYSARHHPDDPPTYEEEMQDRVAARLGLPQVLGNERDWLGSRGLIEASLDEVRAFPCPSVVFWKGGYMGFARWAAARGDQWFLTGSGGDEWLTVDPRYAADLLRRGMLGRLGSFVCADASGTGASFGRVLRYQLWSWGLRLLLGAAWNRFAPSSLERRLEGRVEGELHDSDCPDPEIVAAMATVALDRRRRALGLERRGPSFYRDGLRQAWYDSYMIHEREVAFHAFRAAGTVYTSPYHDRHLLEFLCRVPPELLFRGSRYKGMIRDIASRRLPGLGLERQRKRYSSEPTSSYRALAAELPAAWREIGCSRLAELGLVDAERVEREFDSRVALGHDSRVRLYALLSTEVWLRANFDRSPTRHEDGRSTEPPGRTGR